MSKSIFKCDLSHLEELTGFYDRVIAHLDATVNYPKWTRGEYPGRESIRTAIENGSQYLCAVDGKTVGAFVLNRDPQGNYAAGDWKIALSEGEYMVVHALGVSPGCARQGIGRSMMDYIIAHAREQGCKAVRLDVVPDNLPARKLYESMGFSFAGEKDLERNIPEIPFFALYELVL